jgi:hypothetical protein
VLDDPKLDDLVNLISDSFRVEPNREPIYVPIGDNLTRVGAPQHQVVFGRRGSGKSCLLVHFHRHAAKSRILSVYVNADEAKRLGYPDLLIRLLLDILQSFPPTRRHRLFRKRLTLAGARAVELRKLLDEADEQDVSRERATKDTSGATAGANVKMVQLAYSDGAEESTAHRSEYREWKLDRLERHLPDYKAAIVNGLKESKYLYLTIIVDDFYLIAPRLQADVIDYLHRLVRGSNGYLKIGTIRHRSRLVRYEAGQTIGIEPRQDFEPIDLDQTFENVDQTKTYLRTMLDSMGQRVGIQAASQEYLTPDALFQLALASGGVPRDYLNIFSEAVRAARSGQQGLRLTPTHIYKGAARESYRTKLRNFREDAGGDVAPLERIFQDLLVFCIREKRKTVFLISQQEAQSDPLGHELIQQLMDFKLIHVIEPDTSAASGRPGRYEAYTLDFSSFMEPRRRNIEIVQFWKKDENSRPLGVRESPVYALSRGRAAAEQATDADADAVAESLDLEFGLEAEGSDAHE